MAEENKPESEENDETAAAVAEASAPGPEDTNRDGVIAALRRERRGYVQRGLDARAAAVDAELERLGAGKEEETESAPVETAVEAKPRRTAGRGKPGA